MFMPPDQPPAGKLLLHRRSKTTSVLKSKPKNSSMSLNYKKFSDQKINYKSSSLINQGHVSSKEPKHPGKYQSLRSMTQQIQRLINKQLSYLEPLSCVERNSSRFKTLQAQNPEGNEFNDTFYAQKNRKNIQSCTAGFRQPEYLRLLKKTQTLNSRSFIPHFNWKQKLSRMKNVGNYGHVYKKNKKSSQKKPFPPPEPQKNCQPQFKDYVIDSTKIIIDPQIIISRGLGFQEARLHRKMSACKRCHTSCSEYPNEDLKRLNQTLMAGESLFHSRKLSQAKPVLQQKTSRKGKNNEKDWKFEPWDVSKDY